MCAAADCRYAHALPADVLELRHDVTQILSRLLSALLPALGLSPPDADDAPQRTEKIYVHWLNVQPLRVLVSCRSVAGGIGVETFTHGTPP